MLNFSLNAPYAIGMEWSENRIRLIVYKDGGEFVCRKESLSVLEGFMEVYEGRMFKGRLQLYKEAECIHVQVKGEVVGTLGLNDFREKLGVLRSF